MDEEIKTPETPESVEPEKEPAAEGGAVEAEAGADPTGTPKAAEKRDKKTLNGNPHRSPVS